MVTGSPRRGYYKGVLRKIRIPRTASGHGLTQSNRATACVGGTLRRAPAIGPILDRPAPSDVIGGLTLRWKSKVSSVDANDEHDVLRCSFNCATQTSVVRRMFRTKGRIAADRGSICRHWTDFATVRSQYHGSVRVK